MHPSSVISSINDSLPEFQQYQHRFVEYLRNPLKNDLIPEALPQRSNVYAKLLFSKIEGSLDTCFPISSQLLGPLRWQQLIQTFISDHHCKSPLYREIPDEFIDFLMNEQTRFKLPKFIVELAHYEWMELVLETEKTSQSGTLHPIKSDLLTVIPVLNPVLHLLHYHYPIQNISASDWYWKNWQSRSDPYPQETIILAGLRDSNYQVHFIILNTVTARLIELIREGLSSGEQVLLELAAEMHYGDHETILPFGIEILQQLKQQHIIIGCRS